MVHRFTDRKEMEVQRKLEKVREIRRLERELTRMDMAFDVMERNEANNVDMLRDRIRSTESRLNMTRRRLFGSGKNYIAEENRLLKTVGKRR